MKTVHLLVLLAKFHLPEQRNDIGFMFTAWEYWNKCETNSNTGWIIQPIQGIKVEIVQVVMFSLEHPVYDECYVQCERWTFLFCIIIWRQILEKYMHIFKKMTFLERESNGGRLVLGSDDGPQITHHCNTDDLEPVKAMASISTVSHCVIQYLPAKQSVGGQLHLRVSFLKE